MIAPMCEGRKRNNEEIIHNGTHEGRPPYRGGLPTFVDAAESRPYYGWLPLYVGSCLRTFRPSSLPSLEINST